MPPKREMPGSSGKGKKKKKISEEQRRRLLIIQRVESPSFLALFETEYHDFVRRKLAMYHLKFGTRAFLELSDENHLHLIEASELPTFPALVHGQGNVDCAWEQLECHSQLTRNTRNTLGKMSLTMAREFLGSPDVHASIGIAAATTMRLAAGLPPDSDLGTTL